MRFLLAFVLSFISLFAIAQAPPMVLGGPQGIDVTRILSRNWMAIPVMTDTPAAPLLGSGWPGKGYIVHVAKANDTTVWHYTGNRWVRIGGVAENSYTRLVSGGKLGRNANTNKFLVGAATYYINGVLYNSSFTQLNGFPKTANANGRIDIVALGTTGPLIIQGTESPSPASPNLGTSRIQLGFAYYPPFDTIPTISGNGLESVFREPGVDSIFFVTKDTIIRIKDSIGISKNDTTAMLNPYKFTAANGLTKDSTVFRLGGSLNQNTNINLNQRRLTLIGGLDTTRFYPSGRVSIGGTPDSSYIFYVNGNNSRIGNLEILRGGLAGYTGAGINVPSIDGKFEFQGSGVPTSMFEFKSWAGDTITTDLFNNDKGIMRIYGGFTNVNVPNISGNVLWITPRYRFPSLQSGVKVRGIYYNPSLFSAPAGIDHIAYENTTGRNILNSTSGNTRIGYNTNDTTFKLDVNGDARVTRLLVNTTTVDTSAAANIVSTTKGFLQPRMTNTQRDAITTPATGLQLFSTTDSANYVYRGTGGGWQKIANEITKDTTIDFPSTGHGTSHDVSFTVTGAQLGDVVSIGIPHAAMSANISYTAWVSAANQVTIRLDHYASSGNVDPASGTFKVKVFK